MFASFSTGDDDPQSWSGPSPLSPPLITSTANPPLSHPQTAQLTFQDVSTPTLSLPLPPLVLPVLPAFTTSPSHPPPHLPQSPHLIDPLFIPARSLDNAGYRNRSSLLEMQDRRRLRARYSLVFMERSEGWEDLREGRARLRSGKRTRMRDMGG
jgi:hypothetical protein